MPARRQQPRGGASAGNTPRRSVRLAVNTPRRSVRLAVNTPRRSERLRLQREAVAPSAPTRALNAANERTPVNSSTIATLSIVIHAPRRRSRGPRRWSGVETARIRQAAAEALSGVTPSPSNTIGDTATPQPSGPRRHPTPYPRRSSSSIRQDAAEAHTGAPSPTSGVSSPVSFASWRLLPAAPARTVNVNPLSWRLQPAPPTTGTECNVALGRLRRELQECRKEPPEGCTIEVVDDNMFHWRASIPGPPDTPYSGGKFHLELHFDQNYPFTPPRVYFLTKIYHCNVAFNGHVCVDILSMEWSPALTAAKVLLSIICLLADPNPDDPLEPSIASLYRRDRIQHDRKARLWTSQYAAPGQDHPPSPAYD